MWMNIFFILFKEQLVTLRIEKCSMYIVQSISMMPACVQLALRDKFSCEFVLELATLYVMFAGLAYEYSCALHMCEQFVLLLGL